MIPVILDFDQHRKRKPDRGPIIREDPINLEYTVTFLCLSQTRTWIYNAICRGLFCVQWFEIGGGCWFVFSGLRYKRWLLVLLILEEWLVKLFFYNGTVQTIVSSSTLLSNNIVCMAGSGTCLCSHSEILIIYGNVRC